MQCAHHDASRTDSALAQIPQSTKDSNFVWIALVSLMIKGDRFLSMTFTLEDSTQHVIRRREMWRELDRVLRPRNRLRMTILTLEVGRELARDRTLFRTQMLRAPIPNLRSSHIAARLETHGMSQDFSRPTTTLSRSHPSDPIGGRTNLEHVGRPEIRRGAARL